MKQLIPYGILCCMLFLLPGNSVLAEENAVTKSVCHAHAGNASSEGGCYRRHTKTEGSWGYVSCGSSDGSCGHNEMGPNVCNRQIWKYSETQVTYYSADCGYHEKSELARIFCSKSTEEWTRELVLHGGYEILDPICTVRQEQPFSWNGEASCEEDTYPVIENGSYTMTVQMDGLVNPQDRTLEIRVENIDRTGPEIREIYWNQEKYQEEVSITVTALDSQCGLAEEAYSFDGGVSWQESGQQVLGNGIHQIRVRDRLGNESTQEILVDNVDNEAPVIEGVRIEPSVWTNGDVKITVQAADYQTDLPSGAATIGSGLHQEAFSFDGGKTWSKTADFTAAENGDVFLAVRDQYEHIRNQRLNINNIDRIKPRLQVWQEPEIWTEGAAKVVLYAYDEESGLADQPFSWDGGRSWHAPPELEITEAGNYTAMVRDKAGNVEAVQITAEKSDPIEENPFLLEECPIKYRPLEIEVKGKDSDDSHMKIKESRTEIQEPDRQASVPIPVRSIKTSEKRTEEEQQEHDWRKWILTGILTAFFMLSAVLICGLLRDLMILEGRKRDGTYFGRRLILLRHREGVLYCKVPEVFTEEEQCTHVRLSLNRWTCYHYRNQKITLTTSQGEGEMSIQREMKIRIRAA